MAQRSGPSLQRSLPPAGWIALVWLVLGVISATQTVVGMKAAGMEHHWAALFFTTMADWLVLAIAAPGILWLTDRFPVHKGRWRYLPLHAVTAVCVAVAFAAWAAVLEFVFDPFGAPRSFGRQFVTEMYTRFHTGLMIYAVTMVAANAVESIRRLAQREAEAARLESELTRARLEVVRRRLEPHFLFGALNGIADLIAKQRNDDAVTMIAGLSDLLRRLLAGSSRELVPLAEEISFVESYVDIASMRWGDRLNFKMDVPMDLYGTLVPPLILQPLIDAVIARGFGNAPGKREIRIAAEESGGSVSIRILIDGAASQLTESTTDGDLFEKLYSSACGFAIRNRNEEGLEAVLTLPYRTAA